MFKLLCFNVRDVLNFIICMFSGTVDKILAPVNIFDLFPTNINKKIFLPADPKFFGMLAETQVIL